MVIFKNENIQLKLGQDEAKVSRAEALNLGPHNPTRIHEQSITCVKERALKHSIFEGRFYIVY